MRLMNNMIHFIRVGSALSPLYTGKDYTTGGYFIYINNTNPDLYSTNPEFSLGGPSGLDPDGWTTYYDSQNKIIKYYLYEHGELIKKIKRDTNDENYWRIITSNDKSNYILCKLDDHKCIQGEAYEFENNEIKKVSIYKDDKEQYVKKKFKNYPNNSSSS